MCDFRKLIWIALAHSYMVLVIVLVVMIIVMMLVKVIKRTEMHDHKPVD